jgi:hypothetical protein
VSDGDSWPLLIMSKIIRYEIREDSPGWYKAWVQRQWFVFTYWMGITDQGLERQGWASGETNSYACERHIKKHKDQQVKPFVPRVVYSETL